MAKFKNKYRIESNRLKGWNYANNGLYFITLVTQNRECNLGFIENNKMILSDYGEIVNQEWYKSFEMRDELFLDEYTLMPNHLHAILELKNDNGGNENRDDGADGNRADDGDGGNGGDRTNNDDPTSNDDPTNGGDSANNVETNGRSSLRHPPHPTPIPHPPQSPPMSQRQPKSISSFIAGFKSSVNSKIDDYIDANHLNIPKYNRNNHFFQPNYHDHIIRNHTAYLNIKFYIIHNPEKWETDTFNSNTTKGW